MRNPPDYAMYERIYQVIEQVPPGQVATYGDIAAIVGGGCDARTVGYALGEMPAGCEASVPWQRVINREGGISTHGARQRELLEAEGVEFDANGHVIMARFHWAGPGTEWAAAHRFNTLPPRKPESDAEQLSFLDES